MKLKLVVVSMSVLGLISSSAFAAASAPVSMHKHHKVMHHKVVAHNPKGEEMSTSSAMTNDWFNRIAIDGGVNMDTKFGSRNTAYNGENTARFSLNNVALNLKADINDWTKAFVGLNYDNASAGYDVIDQSAGLNLEQGYITFANASQLPFYAKLGKQFVDFGSYTIHPLTQPVTQVLTESLQTGATVGFDAPLDMVSTFGSVYTFDNTAHISTHNNPTYNYGGRLGLGQTNDQLGWNVSADYIYDFTGVGQVDASLTTANTYVSRVAGGAVNANVNSGPFTLGARYVKALQSFNVADIASTTAGKGAQPWAADITAGYGFNAMGDDQKVTVGYGATRDAVNVLLPRSRWTAAYDVSVLKNATVGAEFDHDVAYSVKDGGTGNSNNEVGVRVGVKFG